MQHMMTYLPPEFDMLIDQLQLDWGELSLRRFTHLIVDQGKTVHIHKNNTRYYARNAVFPTVILLAHH